MLNREEERMVLSGMGELGPECSGILMCDQVQEKGPHNATCVSSWPVEVLSG